MLILLVAAHRFSFSGSGALVQSYLPVSTSITVVRDTQNNKFSVSNIDSPHYQIVARGKYVNSLHESGWDIVEIDAEETASDVHQAFAAGYAEGFLTHRRIWELWRVIRKSVVLSSLLSFMRSQDEFLREKVSELGSTNQYWYNVGLVIAQIDGMLAGYNDACEREHSLHLEELMLMNSDGDKTDLERIFSHHERARRIQDMTKPELIELAERMRCTALIKMVDEDILLVGHATWADFSEMFRMLKQYRFHFHSNPFSTQTMSFSGYPGMISSTDDFVIMSESELVVTETSFSILNETLLYNHINPRGSVLTWIRCIVASRLATNGYEWSRIFEEMNSGTCNCMWMIVELNTTKVFVLFSYIDMISQI